MAYVLLKAAVDSALPTNAANAITAAAHRTILKDSIDVVGSLQFAGVATPSTNPGTPDGKLFYMTLEAGTYTNFGGLVVAIDELTFLKWDGLVWTKEFINILFDASRLLPFDSGSAAKTAIGSSKFYLAGPLHDDTHIEGAVLVSDA